MKVEVRKLAETTSTNTVVAEEARRGAEEGLVVVADYQTAGRGRFDRRWEAPPGASLLFSVLLKPGPPESASAANRLHLAVAAVSLAVAEAAEVVAGVRLSLKWPNDLLGPDGRKVAGVLAEVVAGAPRTPSAGDTSALVVGVGLNVSWAPEEATSLEALASRALDRDDLLASALQALERLWGNWEGVGRLYRERLATLGQQVVVRLAGGRGGDVALRGTAIGVGEDGRLLLKTHEGLVEVAAGDVEHAALEPTRGPRATGPGGETSSP